MVTPYQNYCEMTQRIPKVSFRLINVFLEHEWLFITWSTVYIFKFGLKMMIIECTNDCNLPFFERYKDYSHKNVF